MSSILTAFVNMFSCVCSNSKSNEQISLNFFKYVGSAWLKDEVIDFVERFESN